MNRNEKFWVQIFIYIHGKGQERCTAVSVYISASDVWNLVKIDGIMNTEKYHQIFIHHAIPSAKCLIGSCFIFQYDNDPKHTANTIKAYLDRKTNNETVMDWLPRTWISTLSKHCGILTKNRTKGY